MTWLADASRGRPPLRLEMVTGLGADEFHQIAGVAELATRAVTAGQVATQRDDAIDACRAIGGQPLADAVARLADAAQVRRGGAALGLNGLHRLQRSVLRGATRTEGDRAELGLERIQLLAHRAQLVGAVGCLGRKEFKADRQAHEAALLPSGELCDA